MPSVQEEGKVPVSNNLLDILTKVCFIRGKTALIFSFFYHIISTSFIILNLFFFFFFFFLFFVVFFFACFRNFLFSYCIV